MLTNRSVRVIRAFLGMDQRELAHRAGVSPALVALIESGSRRLTIGVANRFREAFGLDAATLMEIADLEYRVQLII